MDNKVELLSNGMIDNYPKEVWLDVIRVRHWRKLYLCADLNDNEFQDALTSVLDDVINFEKTEFIKTSDSLSKPDRNKLFIWEKINSKGSEYSVSFVCPMCKEPNENKFDLRKAKENRIKKKVKEKIIEADGVRLELKVPSRIDIIRLDTIISEYKEKIFKDIDKLLYISEVEQLEKELKEVKIDENKLILERMKEKLKNKNIKINLNKTSDVEENDIEEKNTIIVNEIVKLKNKAKKNTDKINKILDKNYFNIKEINSIDDLELDTYTEYLFSLCICIVDVPRNYIEFVMNAKLNVIEQIESYIEDIHHGYTNEIIYKCKKCEYRGHENLSIDPVFFLK